MHDDIEKRNSGVSSGSATEPNAVQSGDKAELDWPSHTGFTGSWASLATGTQELGEPKIWTSSHIVSDGVVAASTAFDGSIPIRSAPSEPAAQTPLATSESEDPLMGAIIEDRYQIVDIIGRGGMAVVYLGKQLNGGRLVAMKNLKVNSAEDIMRFAREIKGHSRLSHPNIVEYIEFIATGTGEFFLVMERIKGLSLLDIIKSIGRIDNPDNIATVLIQACDALSFAHGRGVIHRDLKSSNIVLVKQGDSDEIFLKILDFGIARTEGEERITHSGRAVGSPIYMSPEQCMGKTMTAPSDLYSIGIVAYELITGKPPFTKGSVRDIMSQHCNPNVRAPLLAETVPHIPCVAILDQIMSKCLETSPSLRWQSAAQLKAAVEFWITAVHKGAHASSLPLEMILQANENEENDKDFSLSSTDVDALHKLRKTGSMMQMSLSASGKLSEVEEDPEAEQAEQAEALRRKQEAVQQTRREVVRLSVLVAVLLISLFAYSTLNFSRFVALLNRPKEPAPVKQVVKPAPPAASTKDKKQSKSKGKKSRKRRLRSD